MNVFYKEHPIMKTLSCMGNMVNIDVRRLREQKQKVQDIHKKIQSYSTEELEKIRNRVPREKYFQNVSSIVKQITKIPNIDGKWLELYVLVKDTNIMVDNLVGYHMVANDKIVSVLQFYQKDSIHRTSSPNEYKKTIQEERKDIQKELSTNINFVSMEGYKLLYEFQVMLHVLQEDGNCFFYMKFPLEQEDITILYNCCLFFHEVILYRSIFCYQSRHFYVVCKKKKEGKDYHDIIEYPETFQTQVFNTIDIFLEDFQKDIEIRLCIQEVIGLHQKSVDVVKKNFI